MSELTMAGQDLMRNADRTKRPYLAVGDEIDVFAAAWRSSLR